MSNLSIEEQIKGLSAELKSLKNLTACRKQKKAEAEEVLAKLEADAKIIQQRKAEVTASIEEMDAKLEEEKELIDKVTKRISALKRGTSTQVDEAEFNVAKYNSLSMTQLYELKDRYAGKVQTVMKISPSGCVNAHNELVEEINARGALLHEIMHNTAFEKLNGMKSFIQNGQKYTGAAKEEILEAITKAMPLARENEADIIRKDYVKECEYITEEQYNENVKTMKKVIETVYDEPEEEKVNTSKAEDINNGPKVNTGSTYSYSNVNFDKKSNSDSTSTSGKAGNTKTPAPEDVVKDIFDACKTKVDEFKEKANSDENFEKFSESMNKIGSDLTSLADSTIKGIGDFFKSFK